MEIKIKYVLGVVSLYFFVSVTSAQGVQEKPLCNLRSMLTNETFYAQLLNSVLHGERGALECIGGCVIYNIDRFLGPTLRKIAPLPYNFISGCISEGIKQKNTCSIVGCFLNTASSALTVMDAMGIHLPFQEFIKKAIHRLQYNKYEVVNSPAQAPQQQQQQEQPQQQQQQQEQQPQIYQPPQMATPPPPPPPPAQTTHSAANPMKSFGLLNICIAVVLSKFIL